MSIASISYSSLDNASGEAKQVAKRLDRYADRIESRVYQKLNNYSGSWSSNLSTAKARANEKMSTLRDEANKYEKYATDLADLKEKAVSTDKSVKSKVSSLTATFKEAHGIKNNPVVNAISYFFTSVGNENVVGRWLGDVADQFNAGRDFILQSISEWFNFEGGKELLKGLLVYALEIAVGVLAIIGAILSGGALLLVIAGVVAGALTVINAITNLVNEGRAYNARQNGDPALGYRRSNLDTLTDTIRAETDNRLAHGLTKGIDAVGTVATIVSVVGGLGSLLKNGYKWASGSSVDISTLKFRDILTRNNLAAFTGKLKTSVAEGWTRISTTIKYKDWTRVQQTAMSFGTDFLNNFKGKFLDFSTDKAGIDSTKSILEAASGLVKGGLTLKGVGGLAVPIIPIANIPGEVSGIKVEDFKVTDLTTLVKDIGNIFSSGPLDGDVVEKLSTASAINISVPEIHIPGTN
ncbi:hypothetical protein [Niallia sp. Krafla_26]|uniref:hypothetical protein n=1 Tax=Niallia sp. Krafla_26 TaxID=3064703 RepID=UPI003D16AA22